MTHLLTIQSLLLRKCALTVVLVAAGTISANASTYYGGFEDTIRGDYDYNDLVFSLSAPSLSLISSANFYTKPTLMSSGSIGQNGTPFWNNASSDGPSYNVGYCVYGGGTCNGGTGLAPSALYLAATNLSTVGSANDVLFSVGGGSVSAAVTLSITAANDFLGWYNTSSPGTVNFFSATANQTGTYSFTPTGTFGLVGKNASSGNSFYSNTLVAQNAADNVSHFAFFSSSVATPEPGTWALFGSALGAVGLLRRRIAAKTQKASQSDC